MNRRSLLPGALWHEPLPRPCGQIMFKMGRDRGSGTLWRAAALPYNALR